MKNYLFISLIALGVLYLAGCKKEQDNTGQVTFKFTELVDDLPLQADTMKYINEAGNHYMVTEVQYFISKMVLHYMNGSTYSVIQDNGIHYIDSDIEDSHTWIIENDVPAGTIDSITFIFGMDETDNISNRFPDPPMSNMYWPEQLGGGYHYMKLNGKWLASDNEMKPFNFHLGIGQIYDTTGTVTEFIQNYFTVTCKLPVYSSLVLVIQKNEMNYIGINMNIENWFKTPHTWDFNFWGGMMMQNQEAMKAACENGTDVFSPGAYDY